MKVLITGTATGIGYETARKFLREGHEVIGIDNKPSTITERQYTHVLLDLGTDALPEINDVEILVNNAGTVDEKKALSVNLDGYIKVAEKYAFQPKIRSVVNIASISAHTGMDTPRYCASNGGRLAYTKNLAIQLGKLYKATVNSISPGAVLTSLEPELYKNKEAMQAVANETILKKWIMPEEIAEFIYFVSVVNKSLTGQDILIDNGEASNYNFISV